MEHKESGMNTNNKKRRLSLDDDDEVNVNESKRRKLNANKKSIKLIMQTKLGDFNKEFDTEKLRKIQYFESQLSERWNNNDIDTINICSKDLNFGIAEVELLIFVKLNNCIKMSYPHHDLPYFCDALDYFAEKVDPNVFISYFFNHIPAILPSQLISLKSVCGTKECSVLSQGIQQYMKSINNTNNEIHDQILQNWASVSSELLTCNDYVAASVFVNHFKYNNGWIEFIRCRNEEDLTKLWKYIVNTKLCSRYPQIMEAIYNMKQTESHSWGRPRSFVKSLTNIACDVIQIIFTEKITTNNIQKNTMIETIIDNFSSILPQYHKNVDIYDFIMNILNKLLDLRANNIYLFNIYCPNIQPVMLLADNFHRVVGAKKSNFLQEIQRIIEKFDVEEKYLLLELLLNNHSRLKSYNLTELKHIYKSLIELDFRKSFELTTVWFPIFMNTHKQWIINELPNKTSLNILQILIKGITAYITSSKYKTNPCPSAYIEFINQCTNINWAL